MSLEEQMAEIMEQAKQAAGELVGHGELSAAIGTLGGATQRCLEMVAREIARLSG